MRKKGAISEILKCLMPDPGGGFRPDECTTPRSDGICLFQR